MAQNKQLSEYKNNLKRQQIYIKAEAEEVLVVFIGRDKETVETLYLIST